MVVSRPRASFRTTFWLRAIHEAIMAAKSAIRTYDPPRTIGDGVLATLSTCHEKTPVLFAE